MIKISDAERKEIAKEARAIMDSFSKKLQVVDKKLKEEPVVECLEGEREEGEGDNCDDDFRKRMFSNAESKNDDFIIVEKGRW